MSNSYGPRAIVTPDASGAITVPSGSNNVGVDTAAGPTTLETINGAFSEGDALLVSNQNTGVLTIQGGGNIHGPKLTLDDRNDRVTLVMGGTGSWYAQSTGTATVG